MHSVKGAAHIAAEVRGTAEWPFPDLLLAEAALGKPRFYGLTGTRPRGLQALLDDSSPSFDSCLFLSFPLHPESSFQSLSDSMAHMGLKASSDLLLCCKLNQSPSPWTMGPYGTCPQSASPILLLFSLFCSLNASPATSFLILI